MVVTNVKTSKSLYFGFVTPCDGCDFQVVLFTMQILEFTRSQSFNLFGSEILLFKAFYRSFRKHMYLGARWSDIV